MAASTAGSRLSQFCFRFDNLKYEPRFDRPKLSKTPAIESPERRGRLSTLKAFIHKNIEEVIPARIHGSSAPSPGSNPKQANTMSREPEACPACSGESVSELFTGSDRVFDTGPSTFAVLQCADCGLIRLQPSPVSSVPRNSHAHCHSWESVPVYEGRYADFTRQIAMRGVIRFIERCLRAPGPVLEFGAKGGWLAEALAARGIQVVTGHATGLCPAALKSKNGPAAVGFGLSDPCFLPGSFRAIAAFDVLEHLAKPKTALLALRDLLSEGGRLILKIPNVDCWQALLLGKAWTGFDLPRHPFGFGIAEIESLLEHCGYKVLQCKNVSLMGDSTQLVTSLWPRLNPSLRRILADRESKFTTAWNDFLYITLSAAALPLALLEAASGVGASLMIEACRAGEERLAGQGTNDSMVSPARQGT